MELSPISFKMHLSAAQPVMPQFQLTVPYSSTWKGTTQATIDLLLRMPVGRCFQAGERLPRCGETEHDAWCLAVFVGYHFETSIMGELWTHAGSAGTGRPRPWVGEYS